MPEDDASYFNHRAIEEQVAAQRSSCEAARHRHEELEVMYRFRAAMLTKRPQCWADVYAKELDAEAAESC
jgi:hypothetical protein